VDHDQAYLQLEAQNPTFRELRAQHRTFEQRLDELYRKPYLSPDEELETVELKKRKLQLKDRMEHMVWQFTHAPQR
jgi:hypothetical protein